MKEAEIEITKQQRQAVEKMSDMIMRQKRRLTIELALTDVLGGMLIGTTISQYFITNSTKKEWLFALFLVVLFCFLAIIFLYVYDIKKMKYLTNSQEELLNLIHELQKTPVEERYPQRLYTVQILADDDSSYLTFYQNIKQYGASNLVINLGDDDFDYKQTFTEKEMDELKENPKIAIDWDKAIIELVDEK